MKFTRTESTDLVTITLSGEIVDSPRSGLRDILGDLIENDARNVAIDIAASTYIDSLSLAILVDCKNKLRERNRTIKLMNPGVNITKIISIASLEDLL